MVSKIEHKHRTGCPVACALDIIGDHWTLLIIRNMMFLGLHEYKDMLKTEEQISSSILTNRLKKLEKSGLISSVSHPKSQRRKLYYLTPMGKDLVCVMTDIAVWANKHLKNDVKIPRPKKRILENDPNLMIQLTLQELKEWEKKYLK